MFITLLRNVTFWVIVVLFEECTFSKNVFQVWHPAELMFMGVCEAPSLCNRAQTKFFCQSSAYRSHQNCCSVKIHVLLLHFQALNSVVCLKHVVLVLNHLRVGLCLHTTSSVIHTEEPLFPRCSNAII